MEINNLTPELGRKIVEALGVEHLVSFNMSFSADDRTVRGHLEIILTHEQIYRIGEALTEAAKTAKV